VDDLDPDGIERFPRVMREQAGQHEREREQGEQPGGGRQGDQ
jgi:hypothetical protein